MEISNNQTQSQKQPRPLSAGARILCCIVLFACSSAIPLLTFYIGTEGVNPALPAAIAVATAILCAVFALTLCRKPLFLWGAVIAALLVALVSPWFAAMFAALLCAAIATAALTSEGAARHYLPVGTLAIASLGLAWALTRDPLLAAQAWLPVAAGFALSNSYQKKRSVILSVGSATGALIAVSLVLTVVGALLSGMQPSVQGVREYIDAYHAAISALFAETLQLMAETPELAAQLATMLGGEITAETVTAFSDSVAFAVLGMLPGVVIMLTWIFSFIAHRGFTALTVRGLDKKDYPVHLTAYAPSVPTAIFMILCYGALMLFSFIPQAELGVFIALNLLLALLPLMSVCGILSIISNVKQARVKWPLLLTYALAVIFLGVGVIPMVAFFGSFAGITHALASALEKKFDSFKGGQ